MSTFPGSPKVVKGGIVLIDPETSALRRVIVLQYNPDTLNRTLQVQGAGGEGGDRLEALRLKGPPIETIKLDAEIDAADQLELPDEQRRHRAVRDLPAPGRARDDRLPDDGRPSERERPRRRRHPRDRADRGAALALRLEREPRPPGPHHRVLDRRGGVRHQPQPDPREGQPRDARPLGERPAVLA